MHVTAESQLLPVSAERAFAYLSQLPNLPRWATDFVRDDFEMHGDHATAVTSMGPATLRVRTDAETGVIDTTLRIDGQDHDLVFPSRVHPVDADHSLYVITILHPPDQPADAMDDDIAALRRELQGLVKILAA